MKTDPTFRRAARSLDRTLLCSLLTIVEASLHDDGPGLPPLAVAVEGVDAEGVALAVRHLDTSDLIDELADIDAPARWSAFGVVCEGRSRPLVDRDGHLVPDVDADPSPVRLGVLVDRAGPVVAGVRQADDEFTILPDESPLGRIPDACRRVLGLGTPPPDAPIDEFWTRWWLERILRESLERPGALSWVRACALHPGAGAPSTEPSHDEASDRPDPDATIDADRQAAAEVTWDQFRRRFARQEDAVLGVSPALARWMDDGMFSREILSALPPRSALLDDLEPVVAPELRRSIERTLGRWRVL